MADQAREETIISQSCRDKTNLSHKNASLSCIWIGLKRWAYHQCLNLTREVTICPWMPLISLMMDSTSISEGYSSTVIRYIYSASHYH